jgi:hypothetical protein
MSGLQYTKCPHCGTYPSGCDLWCTSYFCSGCDHRCYAVGEEPIDLDKEFVRARFQHEVDIYAANEIKSMGRKPYKRFGGKR